MKTSSSAKNPRFEKRRFMQASKNRRQINDISKNLLFCRVSRFPCCMIQNTAAPLKREIGAILPQIRPYCKPLLYAAFVVSCSAVCVSVPVCFRLFTKCAFSKTSSTKKQRFAKREFSAWRFSVFKNHAFLFCNNSAFFKTAIFCLAATKKVHIQKRRFSAWHHTSSAKNIDIEKR